MRIRLKRGMGVVLILLLGTTLGVALQRAGAVDGVAEWWRDLRRPLLAPRPAVASAIPEELQGQLALFVLAGQSNMSGTGPVPEWGRGTHPRVFVLGNDYRWRLAAEPLDDATGQVDAVSEDPDAGFSPVTTFAQALLARDPQLAIGLIPCARGGSSIAQWERNPGDHTLYGSCLKRVRAASTMGELAGLLFFQGEADAIDPGLYSESAVFPDTWAVKFGEFVDGWRRDVGRPDLPVVFAQIGAQTAPDIFVNWSAVQAQQAAVQLPRCTMIRTADLPLRDVVHLTAEGYQATGERFAQAYWELMQD